MKVLLLCGSPHAKGCTARALAEVGSKLNEHGIQTETVQIGTAPVAGCTACMGCKKSGTCVFDDGVNRLLERLDEFDGIVVGSPVYYAGPSGQLCAFLDRLFYCAGRRMAGKVAAAVVSCRRGGASSAFDRLNKYFTIANMPIVSSQYWNQVHGSTPEDVECDLEGLQTMRTLGENMAWLLASIEAGKRNGVTPPQYEAGLRTNFIRRD